MKKLILFLSLLLLIKVNLEAQNKYPVVKSDLCANCVLWVNPYYTSIADTSLKQPIVVYHAIAKEHLLISDALKADKKTRIDRAKYKFHSLPGFPDEKKVFKAANKIVKAHPLKKGDEVVEGHLASADDYSYTKGGMDTSMIHPFNLGIEWQMQNIGTQLGTEYMCRDTARRYGVVYNWAGCWGSQGSFTDGKIKVNYPAVYWKIVKYANVTKVYWMPNNEDGAGQANYPNFEITYAELVKRLGFDPCLVIVGSLLVNN